MATSGVTNWSLDVADIIEKAARRARGSKLGMLSGKDAQQARDCLNMVLTDISNLGYAMSQIQFKTLTLTEGTNTYTLPSDVQDVFDAVYGVVNDDGTISETALTRIDIAAYNRINNKEMEAFLSQFALHRGIDNITLYLYPTPDTTNNTFRYWAMVRMDSVTGAAQDIDLSVRYVNCLIAGTAYYIAIENPEDNEFYEPRLSRLKNDYVEATELAFGEDRDRTSYFIQPGFKRR